MIIICLRRVQVLFTVSQPGQGQRDATSAVAGAITAVAQYHILWSLV